MQKKTQRIFFIGSLSALLIMVSLQSCKKDKTYPNPTIEFSQDEGYQSENITLNLGEEIKIKIEAETQSDVPLTQFRMIINQDGTETKIDSGINTNVFVYEKEIEKSTAETETWSFYLTDRDGRQSEEISITLNLDPTVIYGDIIKISSLTLGAQANVTKGGFYSLTNQQVYNAAEAYNNQTAVNLLYYYDLAGSDENTIASPGANNDGNIDLSTWSTLNTTRYVESSTITEEEFNNSNNDSLILNNTFIFEDGKRKAKNLASGDIYAFETEGGKKGLFKVLAVTGNDTGTVEISVKMED